MYLRYMTAHVRVNTSITCYAGYFAVHLLRKYTTMLGFLPLASSKIPLLRSAAASLLSDFLVVRSGETKCQLRCRLVYFLATKKPSEGFPPEGESTRYHFCFIPGSHPKPQQVSILSILLRYNRRNLSQPKPCDLGALLKSHLPSAFHPSLTARTFPQIRTVSASLPVGCSLKTSCKCTLFLTAFL